MITTTVGSSKSGQGIGRWPVLGPSGPRTMRTFRATGTAGFSGFYDHVVLGTDGQPPGHTPDRHWDHHLGSAAAIVGAKPLPINCCGDLVSGRAGIAPSMHSHVNIHQVEM
jgi:hypothetical protein